MAIEVEVYQDEDGREPYTRWLKKLKDREGRSGIRARINRVREGKIGKVSVATNGRGVKYFRFLETGPGYRVYFYEINNRHIVLLNAGTKNRQREVED